MEINSSGSGGGGGSINVGVDGTSGSLNPSTEYTNTNIFEQNTNLLNEMNLNSSNNITANSIQNPPNSITPPNDQLENLLLTTNSNNSNNNNNNLNQIHQQQQLQQHQQNASNQFTYQIDSNLDESNALLEQYEHDTDNQINDRLLNEKEQTNQRLFQSFQTSACAVAQMFKEKSSNSAQFNLTAWQSFQNSAGAITVLYKDSLEACKVHYDLGVNVGQQRKLKELIQWLKKKKRRSIRKDELISFLIGRQFQQPPSIFSFNPNSTTSTNSSNSNTNLFNNSQASSQKMFVNNRLNQTCQIQSQSQPQFPRLNATAPTNSNPVISENTCSDLATFREALIMHNRSRDGPLNNHSHSTGLLQNYTNHQYQHHHHQQQHQCDDLDCFFCEQIATHIEHKRSASSSMNNFDMESPTRKRSRFY